MTTTDLRHHPAPHRVRLTDVRRQGWWQLHPGVRSGPELAGALALHDLESIRWTAAKIHEVGDEVGQLREAIAQLVARPGTRRTVHRETTR